MECLYFVSGWDKVCPGLVETLAREVEWRETHIMMLKLHVGKLRLPVAGVILLLLVLFLKVGLGLHWTIVVGLSLM
jgi:hypothetical protein